METQHLLAVAVKNAAPIGNQDDEIHILEIGCSNGIQNVWFGNKTKQTNRLQKVLGDHLSDLPSHYHIHTDIVALLHVIEKECTDAANYAKGHVDEFHYYVKMYHPDAYLFPFARACGGSQHDIGLERCSYSVQEFLLSSLFLL